MPAEKCERSGPSRCIVSLPVAMSAPAAAHSASKGAMSNKAQPELGRDCCGCVIEDGVAEIRGREGSESATPPVARMRHCDTRGRSMRRGAREKFDTHGESSSQTTL